MASIKYILKYGEPASIEIIWSGKWFSRKENLYVLYNGQNLGRFPTLNDLKNAPPFKLPDGATLEVKIIADRLSVLYNGKALEDIPDAKVVQRYSFMFSFGLFALGLLTFLFHISLWRVVFIQSQRINSIGSPLDINLTGTSALVLAGLFFVDGLLSKRSYFWGSVGFSFLNFIAALIFWLVLPYQLGLRENITITRYLFVAVIFFYFAKDVYTFQHQRRRADAPGEQL